MPHYRSFFVLLSTIGLLGKAFADDPDEIMRKMAAELSKTEVSRYDPKMSVLFSASGERIDTLNQQTLDWLQIPPEAREFVLARLRAANIFSINVGAKLPSGGKIGTLLSAAAGIAQQAVTDFHASKGLGSAAYTKSLRDNFAATTKAGITDTSTFRAATEFLASSGDLEDSAQKKLADEILGGLRSNLDPGKEHILFGNAANERQRYRNSLSHDMGEAFRAADAAGTLAERLPLLKSVFNRAASESEFWDALRPSEAATSTLMLTNGGAAEDPWTHAIPQITRFLKYKTENADGSSDASAFLLSKLYPEMVEKAHEVLQSNSTSPNGPEQPRFEAIDALAAMIDARLHHSYQGDLTKSYGSEGDAKIIGDSFRILEEVAAKSPDVKLRNRAMIVLLDNVGVQASNQAHIWDDFWVRKVGGDLQALMSDTANPDRAVFIAHAEETLRKVPTTANSHTMSQFKGKLAPLIADASRSLSGPERRAAKQEIASAEAAGGNIISRFIQNCKTKLVRWAQGY